MIWLFLLVYLLIGMGVGRWAFVDALGDDDRFYTEYGEEVPTKEYKEALLISWLMLFFWSLAIPFMVVYFVFMKGLFGKTKHEKVKQARKEQDAREQREAARQAKLEEQMQEIEAMQLGTKDIDELIIGKLIDNSEKV